MGESDKLSSSDRPELRRLSMHARSDASWRVLTMSRWWYVQSNTRSDSDCTFYVSGGARLKSRASCCILGLGHVHLHSTEQYHGRPRTTLLGTLCPKVVIHMNVMTHRSPFCEKQPTVRKQVTGVPVLNAMQTGAGLKLAQAGSSSFGVLFRRTVGEDHLLRAQSVVNLLSGAVLLDPAPPDAPTSTSEYRLPRRTGQWNKQHP